MTTIPWPRGFVKPQFWVRVWMNDTYNINEFLGKLIQKFLQKWCHLFGGSLGITDKFVEFVQTTSTTLNVVTRTITLYILAITTFWLQFSVETIQELGPLCFGLISEVCQLFLQLFHTTMKNFTQVRPGITCTLRQFLMTDFREQCFGLLL